VSTLGTPESAALIERLRKLVPELAAEAAEAERLRRPTDAAMRALEQSGLFRMMVPRAYGGLELDLDTFLEAGLVLGEADASLAWVASFCVEHNWMLCQFPESFQRELYRARDYVLAPAVVSPQGVAVRDGDVYRLSGRWQWGTGVMHASWVLVSGLADLEPGQLPGPEKLRFFALPIEAVQVVDVWQVDGMVGTGSNDIVIEDARVPAECSVSVADMSQGCAHGARLHAAPLYRTPMIPILLVAASTPVIGQTRAVVRGFRERLLAHGRMNSPTPPAARAAQQARLARAELTLRQAELVMRDAVAEVCALRDAASLEQRARWAASIAQTVHVCRQLLQEIAQASGASAHFTSHPLQRAVRDASVATAHVVFDLDAQLENYGSLRLGREPVVRMF
jgi:alkylation response protein AidB-like acyl-CoA dehydrogenase